MEMWKKIENTDNYSISSLGNVRNDITLRIMKPSPNTKGYLQVGLRNNNITKFYRIHRLLAIHFIDNPENKPQVNHINGIKTDNMIENLEWVTNSENQIHAVATGLKTCDSNRGEKAYNFKLTDNQVLNIRQEYIENKISHRKLAEKYKVSKGLITGILNGKRRNKI